ncbi:hypothetical protein WMY93_007794 [Mugilogobius chulae]|uniref:Uncharacterized protein n=1 Tax=Mugilogobius chulae TaxID=88201 RepID=A0AAW0PSM2_9GOBI
MSLRTVSELMDLRATLKAFLASWCWSLRNEASWYKEHYKTYHLDPPEKELNLLEIGTQSPPDYPAGENKESQEEDRVALLNEIQKRNNDEQIKTKMEKTFPLRRQEILQDMPFITDFKSRWPALFSSREAEEFHDVQQQMAKTVIGIYAILHEADDENNDPEEVGVIIEGVIVLRDLRELSIAFPLLFGLMYVLNLNYPQDLKYTFEFFQKVLMELDNKKKCQTKSKF